MRFTEALLGAGIFLIGCGGGDDGGSQPLGSTTIDPNSIPNDTNKEVIKKPKPGPVDYMTLTKRRGDTPITAGTNKIYRLYHFTQGTNRFTGITKSVNTNGVTLCRIEHGLKDGYEITLFPNITNRLHQAHYVHGLKNGREFYWHKNGQLKIQGQFTNGVAVGPRFSWDENGQTNRIWLYDNSGKLIGVRRFLPIGMKRVWDAAQLKEIYTGKKQSIIRSVFGKPTKTEGNNWIYKGLRVNKGIPNQVITTVTFTIQNGTVTAVMYAE
jgi:antitoxin component YwqK of YwqJK toxin-antitoxin module